MIRARRTGEPNVSSSLPPQPDYAAAMRNWFDRSPWYRKLTARLGLQGKLVICFMFLLLIALSASYWLFRREAQNSMGHATAERAVSLVQTLAMAATPPLESGDAPQLNHIAKDFVKNADIAGI